MKTSTAPSAAPSSLFPAGGWARAAFLHERAVPAGDAAPAAEALADARDAVEAWRRVVEDDGVLRERLALAGVDGEEALLRLLAAPEPRVRPGSEEEALGWLRFVDAVRRGELEGEPLPPLREGIPFSGFLFPFLRWGLRRLRAGVRRLEAAGAGTPLLPAPVERELVGALLERIGPQCLQTLTLELNVARLLEELPGDTPEARFRHFSERRFAEPGRMEETLEEYAVLGRLVVTSVERWSDAVLELLERLEADRPALAEAFAGGRDPGPLASVRLGGSDPHRGGRTVALLEFADGTRIVYKPVPPAAGVRFQALLAELERLGLSEPHRRPTILDRGRYGWMERVAPAPCADAEGARRFFRRQGSLLAVLRLLRATDVHLENLIAVGEHPVVVDLETLLHPDPDPIEGTTAEARARRTLRDSVMRVALLPVLTRRADGRDAPDLSGLSGVGGRAVAGEGLDLPGLGTDEMRVVRADGRTPDAQNLPTVDGAAADVTAHVEELVRGYREAHDLIAANRDAVDAALRTFAGTEVRCLLRHTRHYGLFLREGWHPDHLRDGLDRDRLLDHLWAEAAVRPALRAAVPAEAADLRLGDVPAFAALADGRELIDARGGVIPDFFERDSLSLARETLRGLDEEDRERQVRLIRASLSAFAGEGEPPALPPGDAVDRAALVDGALAAGEHLARHAVLGDDDAGWIGLALTPSATDPDAGSMTLAPLNGTLYAGVAGVALFLAHLARGTGRDDLDALARRALRASRRFAADAPGVGVFTGPGSHLYLLHHLAALWDEPALLDEALAMAPALEAAVGGDGELDLIGGSAGCLVAALDLHRTTGDAAALRLARRCGARLAEAAGETGAAGGGRVPTTGFAHGAAGIAWALARLAHATGDERAAGAARRAVRWERERFDPAARVNDARVAWCNGAPGIALGRALTPGAAGDPAARAEVLAGAEAILAAGVPADPGLCHGALGNADVLRFAAEALDRPAWRDTALRWGAAVAREAAALRDDPGLPRMARSPGLMCGLAGVGLGLLRLADPAAVPSVPALEPPRVR